MELKSIKREAARKSEAKRLRRDGKIPAVVYGLHREAEHLAIDEAEFQAHLRAIKKNHLSVTRFRLKGEAMDIEVVVKEIQYHPTTYQILHLDFEELKQDVQVNINVPIEFTGVVECVGIKLGGVLRQVLRNVRVRCLPKDIPEQFELDVRELKLRQTKRLSDIAIPEGVQPLAEMNEVAVVIAKR